ncbi:hypothetical protein NLI96_g7330 [Meripilus lineatus]|uniref:PEBP-like protein n=1 Tax=Meripilus lineatus TaxID=2056292 RepID=A0AAD5UZD9_9APHY|nr:hypothetical protein NLI96_g7330 [Physisporinus lineatus]
MRGSTEQRLLSGTRCVLLEETLDEPSISFTPLNIPSEQAGDNSTPGEEVSYTLAMLDPDAPTRKDPIYRTFRHWLVTGLKSPEHKNTTNTAPDMIALKSKPDTTPYRPPGPRPNSGLHRYIFLLFQEPTGIKDGFTVPTDAPEHGAALEERRSWNAIDFGKKYGLKLVGVNFFLMRSTTLTE